MARTPIPKPAGPNSRWSTDFVHDQLASGRRFRVLTVIDDVTKECLAAIPDTSITGKRVVREMSDADRPARQARRDRQRQRHRVHLRGGPCLRPDGRARLALHRAGQADPERLRRELPRPDARRVPQRASVLLDEPRPGGDRRMGRRLQHRPPAFGDRLSHPGSLRRAPRPATGTGAPPPRKLRADARCYRPDNAQFSSSGFQSAPDERAGSRHLRADILRTC